VAPPLQVNNAGLLRVIWSLGGTPFAVNVYGFSGTLAAPPTPALASSIATAMATRYGTSGLPAMQHTSVSCTAIGIRDIHRPSSPEIPGTFTPFSGTGTGNLLPLQVSFCTTIRTAKAGRSFRGRSYIPGFAAAANDIAGHPVATVRSACQTWVTNIDASLADNGYQLAVISRPVWMEVDPPTIPPTFTLIREGAANDMTTVEGRDLIWDTQRRRLYPGI
jgi:hypothetical protein